MLLPYHPFNHKFTKHPTYSGPHCAHCGRLEDEHKERCTWVCDIPHSVHLGSQCVLEKGHADPHSVTTTSDVRR